ncbi:MAG: hypothetical protein ABIQ54_00220, partial [Gammaproteobacteria bacterium]
VSTASACTSGSLVPSHVLLAMDVAPRLLRNVLRISLGKASTQSEIDVLLATLQGLHKQFTAWEAKTADGG